MRTIVIDAYLNGTGIRDKDNGGYLNPQDLGISSDTIYKLNDWLKRYWEEYYTGYADKILMDKLDKEGKNISMDIQSQQSTFDVKYYSDASMVYL